MDTNLKLWIKSRFTYHSHPFLKNNGKVIIGYSRMLDNLGINKDEADLMLDNDIEYLQRYLIKHDWFLGRPEGVKNAITIIAMEIGLAKLLSLDDLIKALGEQDWTKASIESIKANWTESYRNSIDVALMIREGSAA
jgi:lysozyme